MAIQPVSIIASGFVALATICSILLSGCKEEAVSNGEIPQEALLPPVAYQTFALLANEETEITGTYGTTVHFPKNCFETPNDTVHLLMYEAYAPHQFILGSATTMTDSGALLTTYGAIHLIALSQGDTLKTRPGKTVRVGFKARDILDKEPELFVGALQDSLVVWKHESVGRMLNTPLSDSIMVSDSIMTEGMVAREQFVNRSIMGHYIYNVYSEMFSGAGWFNCDAYPNDTVERCNVRINHREHGNASDWLIFPKLYGVSPAYSEGHNGVPGINFHYVPVGSDVVYLSFYRDGSEYYLHKSMHRVSRGMTLTPSYQSINGPDALVDSLKIIQW